MVTRVTGLLAVVVLFLAAGAAFAADGEAAKIKAAEPVSAEAVAQDAEAQPVEEGAPGAWAAERKEIEGLRAEADDRIADIQYRLENEDLTGEERTSLHRQVGEIKVETEIRIQEIRLSVAEARGMTRHAEEIRKALESLKNLDGPEETGVVERPESAPAPGRIIEPDQG
jgi:hypothetical protein